MLDTTDFASNLLQANGFDANIASQNEPSTASYPRRRPARQLHRRPGGRGRILPGIGDDRSTTWETSDTMTTEAQNVKFRQQMKKQEANRQTPAKAKMLPREKIRIKGRCKLWGRARAVFRKFGICRICFRNLASDGVIPGVRKARW